MLLHVLGTVKIDLLAPLVCIKYTYLCLQQHMHTYMHAYTRAQASTRAAAIPSLSFTMRINLTYFFPYIDIKSEMLESISELIDEMGNLRKNIADQALEHIHAQ